MNILSRKPIYGFGINDAEYVTERTVHGVRYKCPFYSVWHGMLNRCYNLNYQKTSPSYKGCTVCNEWLTFSNFKTWMINQDWKEKQLDKDLLINGNKTYSPNACVFVTQEVNKLFTNYNSKSLLPVGVTYSKKSKMYQANCSRNKKRIHLGTFKTSEIAFNAYKNFKYKLIAEIAEKQTEPLRTALLNYKIKEVK